ncbi:hypothetical protein L218DRAFT_996523 [Marasmius fiardii PR-910]|nr:hypothetical protein L218DRAFT_996523 [Marasmius fiardii PR-910]
MAIQVALCWLTLTRTWSLESFWLRAPTLASVLNRDAVSVFVAVSGVLVGVIIGMHERSLAVLFAFP